MHIKLKLYTEAQHCTHLWTRVLLVLCHIIEELPRDKYSGDGKIKKGILVTREEANQERQALSTDGEEEGHCTAGKSLEITLLQTYFGNKEFLKLQNFLDGDIGGRDLCLHAKSDATWRQPMWSDCYLTALL